MSRDDIQKLLGGYATGTLTPAEQQALFEAALDDQELFDELGREQALRDLLRDPAAKAHLLAALDSKPPRWWVSWWRPAAAAMVMAGVAVLAVIVVRNSGPKPAMLAITKPQPMMIPREQERDAGGATRSVPARETLRAPADRRSRRDLKDAAADKLTREAPAAALPAAPPPPPLDEKKAEAAPVVESAPVKKEVAQAKDQVSLNSAVTMSVEVKPQASAKALFLRGQAAGGGGLSGFVDTARQAAPQQSQQQGGQQPQPQSLTAEQQQRAQQPQQSPAPPAQQVQQGQQSSLARAKQVSTENAGAVAAFAPAQLGVRFGVGAVVGLRFETNMPISTDRTAVNLEANSNGYLYAWARNDRGAWRPLVTFSAVRGQSYTAPPLRPGEKEVLVLFSLQPRPTPSAPTSPEPATNLVEQDGAVTYVVNPLRGAAGQQLQFTIRLP